MKLIVLSAVVFFGGCAQMAENMRLAQQSRIDGFRAQCYSYGLRSESEIANCVMRLDQADQQRAFAEQQAEQERAAAATRALYNRPVIIPQTPNPTVTCQDMGFGSVMCQ